MENTTYTVKAFYKSGGSSTAVHTCIINAMSAFTSTFFRYVGRAPDHLTRLELWCHCPHDGIWLMTVLDVSGVKELTPALEAMLGATQTRSWANVCQA